MRIIRPQPGFQEMFLSSPADIVIGGGSAGSGKTLSLLLDPIRYLKVKNFGAVIFRRTYPQITLEGGLLDESKEIYYGIGGNLKESELKWTFVNSNITFRHIQHEKNINDYQGAQIPWIGWDELAHFSRHMFFYLLSRNRSTCGVIPCVRATCNPDPDSFLASFIKWWIDDDGFPIKERRGVLRYMTQHQNNVIWGASKKEVAEQCQDIFKTLEVNDLIKSVTFIYGSIYENKELLKVNPQYLGSLMALEDDEKLRLLDGNWKIKLAGNMIADYQAIEDIFDSVMKRPNESIKRYITCDASRLGRDLTVIKVWKGWEIIAITILTKSEVNDIVDAIEALRSQYEISKSKVLVDQDGVGGGTVKAGNYKGFSGGAQPKEEYTDEGKFKENYENLKTQCVYRSCQEIINENKLIFSAYDTTKVDGNRTLKIKLGSETHDIRDLIKQDLRSFRREERTNEGKLKIENKAKQILILGGRSPDFGDNVVMRYFFELKKEYDVYA